MSPQERLERIWMLLCMPDAQRLDMAIKYSAEPYSTRLIEVRKGFVDPQENHSLLLSLWKSSGHYSFFRHELTTGLTVSVSCLLGSSHGGHT